MKTERVYLPDIIGRGYATFWKSKKRYLVVKGSRASKKSKTAALKIIYNMMKPQYQDANAVVFRKTLSTVKDSCYSDLQWAIHRLKADAFWQARANPMQLTYLPTGQKILFRGLDDAMKVTSISVDHGYLCWAWLEEAYEVMDEEDFDMLDESIRGVTPDPLYKQWIITFNPWNEHHWLKRRFFDTQSDDICALTTNYTCNEWLDRADLKLFENMKRDNPRRYKVAGLGEWGITEGVIYENVEIRKLDVDALRQIPGIKSAFGLDFGFTDPTAFICTMIDHKTIYVFDEWYRTGAVNRDIARQIMQMGYGTEKIYCDAAEPKSIQELRNEGVRNATASRKGADSVRYGIQLIQNYKIIIDESCTEFIKEISNYTWAVGRDGKATDKPDHEFSHGPDALRYAVTMVEQPDLFSFE